MCPQGSLNPKPCATHPTLDALLMHSPCAAVRACSVLTVACSVRLSVQPTQGEVLRIRRPHDYNPAAAKALGPGEPSSYINLALLSVVGGLVDEASAPRISVSGLPTHLAEDQVNISGPALELFLVAQWVVSCQHLPFNLSCSFGWIESVSLYARTCASACLCGREVCFGFCPLCHCC